MESAALTTLFVDERASKRELKRSRLCVVEGPDTKKNFVLERERITVGRSVLCDAVLHDPAVSGAHFEIIADEKGFMLRDLGSTNGTFCGELRVQEVWIRHGTLIRVGQSQMRFEEVPGTIEIPLSKQDSFFELVGRSVRMREIFATLEKVAPSDLTILVRGETGTGKELVARAIHQASKRFSAPLVVQDCGAIPKDLIESTLFGHERGAFTGAGERHMGSFEQAHGGTIFLDEIGELDVTLQPKLLRVLENREIRRVGGSKTLPVNVRIVAATNRDLRQMVNEGTFREDLYYRLSVIQITLPSLRERPEDIPLLVEQFLADVTTRRGLKAGTLRVSPEAMARMVSYPWPGNIRELKNTVERAASLVEGNELTVRDLLPHSQKTPMMQLPGGNAERWVEQELKFKDAKQHVLDAFEAAYLKAQLDKHGGNVSHSAKAAGLTRYHFRELAKRYALRGHE